MRLTDSLSLDPESPGARAALEDHLRRLRNEAAEGGFVHLEAALDGAIRTLVEHGFDPASVLAVRVLAWRYDELASMPSRSGTHVVGAPLEREADTLRSLVDEVTREIRKGLLDAARNGGGDSPLRGGEPNEILTPVWKAISELRAVIHERTGGGVRFDDEGAIPLLTLSGAEDTAEAVDVNLSGRRILVADDDAEVRWFYVGVLREAGARVVEASDGRRALELAREEPPDLILADIVMPHLDGLGLCAAVRREPTLDGVPVVLLSWRDDFLHRMRELRAEAQDYLRKELPARQLLARVAGVLAPMVELEESLRRDAEARGDLEELGVATLLRAIARHRPDAALVLQDPWSLFEVVFREGSIVQVARTSIDGEVVRGASVLLPLAGMNTGRFVVTRSESADEAADSLDDAFYAASERLSALISAVAEHPDARVELDPKMLGTYMRHSPRGIQELVARLAAGDSPRELSERWGGSRAVVDALLITLARHGAVVAVEVTEAVGEGQEAIGEAMGDAILAEQVGSVGDEGGGESSPLAARENVRAQSTVSMHREPVNRVLRPSEAIWRRSAGREVGAEPGSSFSMQTVPMSRFLAWGFLSALLSTVVFLVLRVDRPDGPLGGPEVAAPVPAPAPAMVPSTPLPAGFERLSRYEGSLRYEVDEALRAAASEGALELIGPEDVRVAVDGVDRGNLPIVVLLDEGRHVVRYGVRGAWTYRLYYVKRGATRTLRVSKRPGGFVDAR